MADLSTSAPKRGTTPTTSVADLHRLCREDYAQAQSRREAQDHRDDAHLIAAASEAVAAR